MPVDYGINIGDTFGKLTVVGCLKGERGGVTYSCKCSCGKIKHAIGSYLLSGRNKSCGCGQGQVKHGLSRVSGKRRKLHGVWVGMLDRCNNKNNKHFDRYGGRGIAVCPEWHDYKNFHEWAMSNGYAEGLTIDRANNNNGYSPDNCRWVKQSDQPRNTCRVKRFFIDQRSLTIREIAQKIGVKKDTIRGRLRRGLTIEEAIAIGGVS